MAQLASAPPPDGSFGALVRAFRHRAYLSQEQLAARAELSERTVRNLEADRVRSPRNDTVRLLADALGLTEPDRQGWFAAALGANDRRAEPVLPGPGLPAQLPSDGPVRPRLNTRGFDMGNNSRNHRSLTMKFRAEVVCEFVVRASPCGRELARIEAVLAGDAQDASWLAVTCLIDWAGETPCDGVRRKTLTSSRQRGRWLLCCTGGPLSNPSLTSC
jgi:transcriptional regulator with XRE-family HTH domain